MKRIINTAVLLTLLYPAGSIAQEIPVFSLDTVLNRIAANNLLLQSYAYKAESFREAAAGANAWMAPMIGAGTFMTPYPGQKVMDNDKGQLMLQLEQSIPNRAKQKAKEDWLISRGNVELAGREVTLNDFRAVAKNLYSSWQTALKKIDVLRKNEALLMMMKKIEEVRLPYNQSLLGNIYKAEAAVEENRNRIIMEEGTISEAMAMLNGLMNRPATLPFQIDTTFEQVYTPALVDTFDLASNRKDIYRMDENIRSMFTGINAMQLERKPEFRIRFDHMSPLGGMMPQAFSVMGMVSIPIAPWSSGMYKSEIRSMRSTIRSMELERGAMLQESMGKIYGMMEQIRRMQKKLSGMKENVIPALQRSMDVNLIGYQENRLPLTTVIDSWEALTMMQLQVLEEAYELSKMIISYEKELYR